jgi:hypothetical protein
LERQAGAALLNLADEPGGQAILEDGANARSPDHGADLTGGVEHA